MIIPVNVPLDGKETTVKSTLMSVFHRLAKMEEPAKMELVSKEKLQTNRTNSFSSISQFQLGIPVHVCQATMEKTVKWMWMSVTVTRVKMGPPVWISTMTTNVNVLTALLERIVKST